MALWDMKLLRFERTGRERNIPKEMRLDEEGGGRGPGIHTSSGWVWRGGPGYRGLKECEAGLRGRVSSCWLSLA